MRILVGRVLLAAALILLAAGMFSRGARAASGADRAAGAALFKEKGCEHCHGVDGVGTERGPSLSTVGKRLKRDAIERQIREGGKQMPPFGDVLKDDEVKQLVEYLAHKKKAPKAPKGAAS